MEQHFQLSDREFEQSFADASMPPGIFSHEAHLRLAWIHIRKYGLARAIENVCTQIRKFDLKHGDGTKYDKEMTVKAITVVAQLMDSSDQEGFDSFLRANPALLTNFKGLLDGVLKTS